MQRDISNIKRHRRVGIIPILHVHIQLQQTVWQHRESEKMPGIGKVTNAERKIY